MPVPQYWRRGFPHISEAVPWLSCGFGVIIQFPEEILSLGVIWGMEVELWGPEIEMGGLRGL